MKCRVIVAASCAILVAALVIQVIAQQHQVFYRGSDNRHSNFVPHFQTILDVVPIMSDKVKDVLCCALSCLRNTLCMSFNAATDLDADKNYDCQLLTTDKYNSSKDLKHSESFSHYSILSPCERNPCQNGASCRPVYEMEDYKCICVPGFGGKNCEQALSSCGDVSRHGGAGNGVYNVMMAGGEKYQVYCDLTDEKKGWTLIARFSNNDDKNWMKDSGEYWYDRNSAIGQTTKPADNTDMISPAFWSVKGTELKITRSDDSSHTALLHTTGDCLGGQTFRSKITSYGDFRNSRVWATDQCLGSCDVQYGGQYKNTDGFNGAECDGAIQQRNKIGFWCDCSSNGAVITIGGAGGGSGSCNRADHGVGITQADEASFAHDQHGDVKPEEDEYDFGRQSWNGDPVNNKTHSLDVWVR